MGLVPALVLLGLGLGLGPVHLVPTPAPRGTLVTIPIPGAPAADNSPPLKTVAHVSEATLCSIVGFRRLALLSCHVRIRLQPRTTQRDSLFPSGGRSLASSHGPARRLRMYRLHVRILRRAAPTHIDPPLSAPRRLLSRQGLSPLRHSPRSLEWTFHLGLVRRHKASSTPRLSPRSIVPGGPHPNTCFLDQSKGPTKGPVPVALEAVNSDNSQAMETSVSCQLSTDMICVIKKIKISVNEDGSPVVLTRKMDLSLNATHEYDRPFDNTVVHRWEIFSVPKMYDVPDWSKPLDIPELQFQPDRTVMYLPKESLSQGHYAVRFSVTLTTAKPKVHVVSDFDHIYITVVRSPLVAVISRGANITVNFTDELVLDGSKSSDPDADSPLDGLYFSWYCTTNPNNYKGQKITVMSKELCHPDQADLQWTGGSRPVLTLFPKMLKGDRIYFFRMVIKKGGRTAFSDKKVHVQQGSEFTANIVCIENCDTILVISERFSLFLNCSNCAVSRDVFKWSILSSSGKLSDKLVRISLFYMHCLDMFGIQSDWREDICVLGEMTTWDRVHCVCKNTRRTRRQLNTIRQANIHLHARYLTAKAIVVPNPVDLRLEVIKKLSYNLVTIFTLLFIMLTYILLAIWTLYRDETDKYLRDSAVVLLDNDPYDRECYLVTIFTGSRSGAGTRANVFVQLRGTKGSSDVHCLSHPHFTTLYRGSISTFLLTTKRNLGDIHSIRVWHDNEGRAPSWYLSRIKVENLFSRHIWLFMCRKWLSIDTSLDRTFRVTHPDEPLKRMDFFLINVTDSLQKNHMWFSVFSGVIDRPFSRLQRLSCCLAMLLSSLMCNIMFFNLNRQETEAEGTRYIRAMVIGLASVLITVPVQVVITFLFTYSQSRGRGTLYEVYPRETLLESEYWEERLEKWHAQETAEAVTREAEKLPPKKSPGLRKSPSKATSKRGRQLKKAESKVSGAKANTNVNANNKSSKDDQGVESAEPSSQPRPPPLPMKPSIVLPRWCVYVAWGLVFATSSISSFFIAFSGLTYSYEEAIEWLFASFCSFFLSVFLVQPSKIILLSGIRLNELKYCKNVQWVSHYRYTEITLQNMKLHPDEMRKRHNDIIFLRGTRMYQTLRKDEIRIFQRKKRLKKRALLFLSYLVTHFIFLALLLWLVALLRHTDTFYYNQFLRNRFSVDLATVTKLQDIYSWLNDVLVPLLHNSLNPTFLPESASIILGLPLMRQVRAKSGEKACLPAKNFVPSSIKREIHCHPKYGTDPEDTQNYSGSWIKIGKRATDKNTQGFTYKPQEKRWPYRSHGLLHTYGSGGYAFYFFPDQEQFNSTERLKGLRSSKWLDEKTWAVILELTTWNPDANLFGSLSVVFEVSPLGVVNTSLSVHSFVLADFNRNMSAEIYLYAAILIFFLAYFVDEGYVITQERATYVKSVYNLLNFALKSIFAVLIVLFLRKHFLAAGLIQFHSSNSADFIPFHAVSQVDHAMRVTLGFLLFLTILKTLRYSRVFYDVRLAQRAIQTALPGIFHMALVVSVYFFVYMAFGYLVFGQHEWNYSNLVRASQTIFSYCVSAFQNTEFSENRVLGVLFLSSFMLVMICILINLFQAVILSVYEEMKQPVYEEPSEEVEAMAYLCGKLRTIFGFLFFRSKAIDEPAFFVDMLYGQPEKNSRRYLGLKTRNINGRKMVYLVV